MRYLAAYLMLVVGGNASPSAEDVKALLATVGVEVSLVLNLLQIESLMVHVNSVYQIFLHCPPLIFLFLLIYHHIHIIQADDERLSALLTDLEGKNVEELCALGQEKLMKGAAVSAAAAPAAAASAAPAAAEKPKEKPKVEEVDALDGGMSMFGGSGGAKDY